MLVYIKYSENLGYLKKEAQNVTIIAGVHNVDSRERMGTSQGTEGKYSNYDTSLRYTAIHWHC